LITIGLLGEGRFPMCDEKMKKTKPSSSAFLINLQVDMPLSKKMWLIFKNQWIKIKRFQACCDHPGEPGC
jgi:hypothetical protein